MIGCKLSGRHGLDEVGREEMFSMGLNRLQSCENCNNLDDNGKGRKQWCDMDEVSVTKSTSRQMRGSRLEILTDPARGEHFVRQWSSVGTGIKERRERETREISWCKLLRLASYVLALSFPVNALWMSFRDIDEVLTEDKEDLFQNWSRDTKEAEDDGKFDVDGRRREEERSIANAGYHARKNTTKYHLLICCGNPRSRLRMLRSWTLCCQMKCVLRSLQDLSLRRITEERRSQHVLYDNKDTSLNYEIGARDSRWTVASLEHDRCQDGCYRHDDRT